MRLTNKIFQQLLRKFVIIYFDDIFIFSQIKEEYLQNLYELFKAMRMNKLYASPKKYGFVIASFIFITFFVYFEGVKVDQENVKSIQE